MKKADEIIIQYANRVYEHQANEAAFYCTCADFQMSDCVDMLNEYAEQFKPKWISVEEDELPPFEIKTMIILENGETHLGYYNGADTKGDCWFCDNNDYFYPTHWRLLLESPTN